MNIISNHFDLLHFTECIFEKPVILGEKIIIPTHELGLLTSHPLNQTSDLIFLPQCCLIFEKVKKSVRQLTGYVEDSPGTGKFKPSETLKQTVVDGSFPNVDEPVTLFELEGIFQNPLEWVDWEIESAAFYLLD